jgi:hypothetical protein
MSAKQQILEPISTIAKLALLQFKSQNTKISIRNFCIHYDDPPSEKIEKMSGIPIASLQQALARTFRGDSREDMAVLNNVIINYIDWYIINNSDEDSRKQFIDLISIGITGLKKLQTTYLNHYNAVSNVVLTLQYYITLIEDVVNNTEMFVNNIAYFHARVVNVHSNELQNLVNINSIKELWSDEDLSTLYFDISHCVKHFNDVSHSSLTKAKMESITTFLNLKDETFMNMVRHSIGG